MLRAVQLLRPLTFAAAFAFGCSNPSPGASAPRPETSTAVSPASVISITTRSATARQALERGQQQLDDRRNDKAIAEFKEALRADPDFALAHAYLGHLLPAPEGPDHAARALSISSAYPQAERLFIEAQVSQARGEDVRVRELRTRVATLAPGDYRAHFELAEQLYDDGRFEAAAKSFRRTIELNPKSSAYNGLGYSLAALGRLDEAVAALRKYVEVRPDEPNPRDSLGEVALFAGNYEEAEASFLKATELSPQFWGAWNGVAQTRFFRGDYPGGFAALTSARAAAPSDVDRVKVYGYRAWAELAAGNGKGALKALDAMEFECAKKRLYAQASNAAILRSAILIELGRHQEALKWSVTALERLQSSELPRTMELALRRRTLVRKVMAEAALGKIDEVEKTLQVLVEDGKRSGLKAEIRWGLRLSRGVLALARGNKQAAIAELSQCDLGANSFSYTFASQPEIPYCVWRLAQLLDENQNAAGAQRARQSLLRANLRDPAYTYLRARVVAELKTASR